MKGVQALKIITASTTAAMNLPEMIARPGSVVMNSRSVLVSECSAARRKPVYAGRKSMHVASSTICSEKKMSRPAWKSDRSSRPSTLLTIRKMPMTSSCRARNSSSTATTNRLCTAWRSSLTTIGFRASSSLARNPGDFIALPLGAVGSTEYAVHSTPLLGHGLPTVPPPLTEGLHNKRRPGGRAPWHGRETKVLNTSGQLSGVVLGGVQDQLLEPTEFIHAMLFQDFQHGQQ